MKGELSENNVGRIAAHRAGLSGKGGDARAIVKTNFRGALVRARSEMTERFAQVLANNAHPVFRLGEGFDGLALAASEDDPVPLLSDYAVEHGFGGAGVILAGLARPKADLEWTRIREPLLLVRKD